MRLGTHRCVAWCRDGQHVTFGYESRHAGGQSWFTMVGGSAVIDGVLALVVAVEPAPEARPAAWDPSATALLVSWKPVGP